MLKRSAENMKSLFIILLLCKAIYAEATFDEALLNKWGYKTTSKASDNSHQSIRSLKDYGKKLGTPNLRYYARYSIWKESFKSEEEAAAQKQKREKALQEDDLLSYKAPRIIIQKGNELYFIASGTSVSAWEADHRILKDKVCKYLKVEPQKELVEPDR